MTNLFTNLKLRLSSEKYLNPDAFKNVTLMIDGHDSKIKYYNPDVSRKALFSHKFKKPGLRTQTLNDVNNLILFVFKSERCAIGNDGTMFIKMNLQRYIHIADCIAADGGYTLFVNKFKEISANEGYDFSDKIFSTPIRKEPGVKLTSTEITYNTKFGAYRSGNESIYSVFGNKFDRFNNNNAALQITNIETYNLQFKICALIYNLWRFCETFKIEAEPHHKLWYNEEFDFPTKTNRVNYVFLDKAKNDENFKEMVSLQEQFLNMDLDDNNMKIEYESEIEEVIEKRLK